VSAVEFETGDPFQPKGEEFMDWLEERDDRITACATREGGHGWQIEGEPGEEPYVSCGDCPADADELFPDLMSLLSGPMDVDGRTVVFGEVLPDQAEPCKLPVAVRVETIRRDYADGTEYDVEVHITPRGGDAG
jgi:hypothetical protein